MRRPQLASAEHFAPGAQELGRTVHPAPGPAWNFSSVSVLSSGSESQTPAGTSPGGPPVLALGPNVAVGAVDDPLEREADRAADYVLQTQRPASSISAQVQSNPPSPTSKTPAGDAPGIVGNVLRSPGQSLEPGVRGFMESRLGHDFNRVRVHDDALGVAATRAAGARAFTVGGHIAFAEPLNTSSPEGRRLLAHELAHVAQQSALGRSSGPVLLQRDPVKTQGPQQGAQQAPLQGSQLPQPIVALLQQASEGQWALNVLKTYNVTLVLTKAGREAYYDANANSCTLNVALPAGVAAAYFIHEMYHAQEEKTGRSGDSKKMDKRTFVKLMVDQEIQGTVKGYLAYMEMEQKGQIPHDARRPPRYESVKSAYNEGRAQARKANPNAAEAELHRGGIKNAEAAIRWYVNEGGLGPAEGVTYRQSYGAEWERANRPPH